MRKEEIDYKAIDKRLRGLPQIQNLSQEQLAAKTDITTVYLSNVDNRHGTGSLPTFFKLANGLGCGVDVLFCYNINDSKHRDLDLFQFFVQNNPSVYPGRS